MVGSWDGRRQRGGTRVVMRGEDELGEMEGDTREGRGFRFQSW